MGSVVRTYECLREGGGCGQVFTDAKPEHAIHNVMCPNCSTDGLEMFTDEYGRRVNKIAWIPPRIHQSHDLDHQDGRTGDSIEMPSLGPNVRVSSRRELDDALKRTREEYYRATHGPHSTIRPFKDPETGRITMEKVTVEREGFDLGELHHLDSPEVAQPQRSPFDPKLSADEHIARLNAQLGSPADHPTPESVPRKRRGRPKGTR